MVASGGRPAPTVRGTLVRLGFVDPERARDLLAHGPLCDALGVLDEGAPILEELGRLASPDDALLTLDRMLESTTGEEHAGICAVLTSPGSARARLLSVLGTSTALGDHLVRHPSDIVALEGDDLLGDDATMRAELLAAVGARTDVGAHDAGAQTDVGAHDADAHDVGAHDADVGVGATGVDADDAGPAAPLVATVTGAAGVDALRRAYRRRLLMIAAADLTAPEPTLVLPAVAAALAHLAGAALEGALALARAEQPDHGLARLAVMGMGKCGGSELNYVSDVDVIFVAEPAEGASETDALAVATRLAAGLSRACSAPSDEPALWPVDAALRPEGKQGPLVRTVASHAAYYARWAKTWEFQALLKARVVAGDRAVGAAYLAALHPMVWSAAEREHFVEDSQAMRRRVEDNVPAAEADRQIKLGPGGLRDVEFTVQLLQLVHGRTDPALRSPTTLDALAALTAGGYVGRDHAVRLAVCYRTLRVLEHRVQLYRMRRTHLMPTTDHELRRLARSVGLRDGEAVLELWRTVRRDVRRLHEELFYRPLLPETARLSREDVSLAPEAARARLAAIGYRDPAGAMRHITALTEGVSRRAAIQRQLLPVLLGWFAEGSDPDAGLLSFRRLSDELGSTHWYLKLLRDSGAAAQRLARVLASSRYVADALARSPESVAWLDDDADLAPRGYARLASEADAILTRQTDVGEATVLMRALWRREMARTAVAEVLALSSVPATSQALTAAAEVLLSGGLRVAEYDVAPWPLTRVVVVAMGRMGGAEMGYGSDADVLFVHDPLPGVDPAQAQAQATAVAARVRSLLAATGPEPGLEVDADLRPEGRNGPLVRTLASYGEYYERWSSPWESQALLRARPVAGSPELGARFVELIAPIRYPDGGASAATVREVRRLKARMEAERLPRGIEPARHLKLGRGGLSDVEWSVQLLQLRHAYEVPGLRTPSTLEALEGAAAAGVLDAADAAILREAWVLSSRLRDAIVLWTGRAGGTAGDVLPHDRRALNALARMLGMGPGAGGELEETYLRTGRRARGVMERIFYD